jgi:hypothetical protein
VRAIRDAVVHGVMTVVGALFGVLSAIALAIAAVIPAILGMLAFALSPLRALIERLRGQRTG